MINQNDIFRLSVSVFVSSDISNFMFKNRFAKLFFIFILLSFVGCQQNGLRPAANEPTALREVSALKLNFRFEPDVPEPAAAKQAAQADERIQSVQSDFDANRTQEALDKTLSSPDKQRVLAVYHRPEDAQAEYRLDMYAADGKLISKITPGAMAVHFPDTIVWSPDSGNVAFVAMTRAGGQPTPAETAPTPPEVNTETNANVKENTNVNAETNTNIAQPTPVEPAKAVLTFRTEQIYSANRDGGDLKPLTQNEGLIYFYFVWSPDSSALAALAATWREWQLGQAQTAQRGEIFIPSGRPRLVEKNGRIRILDDNVTAVHPAWSPDSSKVALAFDKEIRIYDATADNPTQAAIPLRNQLLLSSKTFDDGLRRKEQSENSNANANGNANANSNTNVNLNSNVNSNSNANAPQVLPPSNSAVSALPDENSLVSFNPIIKLEWTEDSMLYLETGYVKEMQNSANSAHSYLRWHRLIFSPQPSAAN
ncbi:MAG: hypothetical protein ACR2N3_10570 [Pyrinomonadaceae bacterium]